jgi:hypothetical protein
MPHGRLVKYDVPTGRNSRIGRQGRLITPAFSLRARADRIEATKRAARIGQI